MKYKQLGRTNIQVSAVGFGSVEIGQNYGIYIPGDYGKPDEKNAIRLIEMAIDSGINLFDTAASYGDSEKILGRAIGSHPNCYIATKVNIPPEGSNSLKFISASINQSLHNLNREYLDIIQVHNATLTVINKTNIIEILLKLRKEGKIRFIGASVYESENAMGVINADCFDVLQIAYNILDQRMADKVIPSAAQSGIGIFSRSAYFKGVLTAKAEHLPKSCLPLKKASAKVKDVLNMSKWEELTSFALRFCLSTKGINSVLVGIRTPEELKFAVEAEKTGILPKAIFNRLLKLGIEDKFWLNPVNWPLD